jgi:ABC-type branched-subunit amino acid transport system ATPase component
MSTGEATSPLLEARGLRKAFGGNLVLDDVNLQFQPRRVSALIGPDRKSVV